MSEGVAAFVEVRPAPPSVHCRVLDAALSCFGRWGLVKTTLDDVAREAGLSRATVYRAVPGGKSELVREVALRELTVLAHTLEATLDEAATLEDLLVDATVAVARAASEHPLLQYLLAHNPNVLLPFVAFDRLGPALELSATLAVPHLVRFVDPTVADEVSDWMTRMILSFTFVPGSVDLTDAHHVRQFVQTFVLPGIELAGIEQTDVEQTGVEQTGVEHTADHPSTCA